MYFLCSLLNPLQEPIHVSVDGKLFDTDANRLEL